MMRYYLFICLFGLMSNSQVISENFTNNNSDDSKNENKILELISYDDVDVDDIVWSRVVYEEVDLSQKFNHPLYFPKDGLDDENRKSLWYIIRESILTLKIKNIYNDANPNFTEKMDSDTFLSRIQNTDGPEPILLRSADISSYILKGVWYFDKRRGELFYKILGIMPRGRDMNNFMSDDPVNLFWISFDDLRPYLLDENVLVNKNNSFKSSFDKILTSRVFSARIIGTNNMFNNRFIEDYIEDPFMQLIESEKIKNNILNFELDLWID